MAGAHDLPLASARVRLAQGDGAAARSILVAHLRHAEERQWADERLETLVLLALAHRARGEGDEAMRLLSEALAIAEPEGLVRVFVDEGRPMALVLADARGRGILPEYVGTLSSAFDDDADPRPASPLEPLSRRELDVLRLIADGHSNVVIGQRLFRAVSTVKNHNRSIFEKLQVRSRTQAVARARELGLL